MTSRNVFGYSELIKLLLFISPVLDTIPFRGKHLLDHTVPYGTYVFSAIGAEQLGRFRL